MVKRGKQKRNIFREFIEELSQLNGFGDDPDVKTVDEALAYWVQKYYPKGFNFDYNKRNLLIAAVKKKHKLFDLIINSDFRPYLDAIMEAIRQNVVWAEMERAQKSGRKVNGVIIMRNIYREIVVLGYCLGLLEKQGKEKKEKNKKSR